MLFLKFFSKSEIEMPENSKEYIALMNQYPLHKHNVYFEQYRKDTKIKVAATKLFFANIRLFTTPENGAPITLHMLLQSPLAHLIVLIINLTYNDKNLSKLNGNASCAAEQLLELAKNGE